MRNEKKYRIKDKEYQAIKRSMGKIDKTEEYRLWRLKNPKGAYAQQLVCKAIKKGKLIRGSCGLKDKSCAKGKIQAHHEDYEMPYEVIWLCASHHKKVDLGLIKLKTKNI